MKGYLLDTHALLWMIAGDKRLSRKARHVIEDPGNALHFSMASYWELCLKVSLGKLTLQPHWEKQLDRELDRNSIQTLPVMPAHCRKLVGLEWIHRDPFDRLLVAQSLCDRLAILTADTHIAAYPHVRTLW